MQTFTTDIDEFFQRRAHAILGAADRHHRSCARLSYPDSLVEVAAIAVIAAA